jgi:CheY-like chemotaxis protein
VVGSAFALQLRTESGDRSSYQYTQIAKNQLSGMDGITAMKQLKAAPKTNKMPITASTASAMT